MVTQPGNAERYLRSSATQFPTADAGDVGLDFRLTVQHGKHYTSEVQLWRGGTNASKNNEAGVNKV